MRIIDLEANTLKVYVMSVLHYNKIKLTRTGTAKLATLRFYLPDMCRTLYFTL